MTFKRLTLLGGAFLFSFASFAEPEPAARSKIRVMAYNVQNLFDTKDDPATSDEEFTPSGKQHWTEKVLRDKMKNLGEIFSQERPDIIGLSEVENQEVVDEFLRVGLAGQGYTSAYAGPSEDDRGIRCALISKFPIVGTKSHRVWDSSWTENGQIKKSRDILEVTVRQHRGTHQQEVTYLVNHWPSRAGNTEFRNRIRLDTARKMKKIMENLVRQNPARLVVAMGDFNDEIQDASIRQGLKPLRFFEDFLRAPAGSTFVLDSELENLPDHERGTYYFGRDNQWNSLDHMVVAAGQEVLSGRTPSFKYVPKSIEVVRSRFVSQGKYPQGCEIFGKPTGNPRESCPNGASDHFPIAADFSL